MKGLKVEVLGMTRSADLATAIVRAPILRELRCRTIQTIQNQIVVGND